MKRLKYDYGDTIPSVTKHDYYRTTREAFGTSLRVSREQSSSKAFWFLIGLMAIVAAIAIKKVFLDA